ncbi:reticulon-4-interacting protein 1 homolog, mitochondrial-like [Saccostrea echinata]|uniref:reticulon-4-interacting protein 1 homolog, mitochondrial-like n=1 Tax=Saccostrea echinata TaxID=191078 RepID=UPI002A7F5D63|nr:reticulon-4-interacting protein 1 homolog, mitochondrial-like [Saccostrea echinata]
MLETALITKMAKNILRQSYIKLLCSSPAKSHNAILNLASQRRHHTKVSVKEARGVMRAWQIRRYGGNDELTWSESVRVPRIIHPEDVLVNVTAASLNMLDIRMRGGYGHAMLNAIRNKDRLHAPQSEFPLILGRDFSGTVLKTGMRVKKFKVGDKIWGTVSPFRQGSHAEFTVTSESHVSPRPHNLSDVEAASLPYVVSTVMTALCDVGELRENNTANKRALIYGGSGGIGTFAIQLMKAWGAIVTTTCSTDAVPLVTSLGADHVIDYKTQNVQQELMSMKGYDLILDIHGGVDFSFDLLKKWNNSKFVTIKTPFLQKTDEYGILPGLLRSGANLTANVLQGFKDGRSYRWAMFKPSSKHLQTVKQMVEKEEIKPVIDTVFPFEKADKAYEKLEEGHARGKIVINMCQ